MEYLILLTFLLPLVLGVVLYFKKIENRNTKNVIIGVSTGLVFVLNVVLAFFNGKFNLFNLTPTLNIGFMIDRLGSFFAIAISFVWLLVTIYSFEYMKHEENEDKFYCFFLLSFASLMGMCYSRNLATIYVFFELITLCSFPLVMHSKSKESISASMKYLFYSIGGAFLALIGLFFLINYSNNGDFTYGGIIDFEGKNNGLLHAVIFLGVLGFGAKAGMFPLQSWLPTAHPVAPSNASSVLSGIITKAGVFVIIRIIYYVVGTSYLVGSWVQTVLIILALITIVLGSGMAWACKNLKKRLAYSTVSQVSYILLGVFVMNEVALVGSLLHVLAHMGIKVTLFLSAGAIIYKIHKRDVNELVGIGKIMPIVIVCYSLASLGLVGVPPLGGFYSKWFLATGALSGSIGALGYVACVVLLVSAILTAAYLLPIMINGFFVKGEEIQKDEPNKLMTIPLIILVTCVFLVGILSGYISDYILGMM